MATKELFNAKTQQVEKAEFSVDDNNEIVAVFKDGGHVKFPAGLTAEQLNDLIDLHEEQNAGQEVITPEQEAAKAEARAASFAALGEVDPDAVTETSEKVEVKTSDSSADAAKEAA